MKEITRRLYTKPVMLGMALLLGVALVVGLFVTRTSTAAPNSFPVAAGNDEFETAGDGETFHDFGGTPIPVDFFGTGSKAFTELVPLVGVPLGPGSDVDTIIQRHQTVSAPGGKTTLTMTGLSLRSINPITVTYSNGTGPETWNMAVSLSDYKASTGSMTIFAGSFDSTLKVWPKFTFTRVGGGAGSPLVLDTGGPGGPGLTASAIAAPIDGIGFEPAPAPMPAPTLSPCRAVATPIEGTTKIANSDMSSAAVATSTCAPITLSSVNSPWVTCATGGFCIPVPITEEERWARHRPGPRGTIKGGAVGK